MQRVRQAFAGANEALTIALLKRAQKLYARKNKSRGHDRYDRYEYARYEDEAYEDSILGSVVGVTDEV